MSQTACMQTGMPEARGSILVVDDSLVVRAIVARYLKAAGYLVQEAENGAVALNLLDTGSYDVVVTDLRMPELDGFGVLEAVRQRGLGTEVIILTGTHAQDMSCAIRALRLGAHDFLTKPPSGPDEVVLTVDRAVEKKRLREANLRLVRELESLTRTDSLTGALNRRAFDESLRRETGRARRYGFPMSLALFDIDHFKKVNDMYGHPAGDAVLQGFARLASTAFRETDSVHRYGGEEFAVLMPHTGLAGATEAVQRLIHVTAQTPFRCGEHVLRVTVSAGVVCGQGDDLARADLVTQADAALYMAKHAGRNRVCTRAGLELVSARKAV